jgi:GNAT superfamily N-acetyltransferase
MIRDAMVEDVRSVAEYMKEFEEETAYVNVDVDHATKQYKRLLKDGNAGILMLINDKTGEMNGALGYVVSQGLHDPLIYAIETFWMVSKEHRGRGISLFFEFEKKAKALGADKIAMIHMVDSHPEVLARLYKKKGYDLIEHHYMRGIK